MFCRKYKEQLEDAERLIMALETFIFVAKTDGTKSGAVDFVDRQVMEYREKYK